MLDHVNVRTTQLDEMVVWYRDVLGMTKGPRPDFPFPGAWMYVGGDAFVHLVEVPTAPNVQGLRVEHFAFKATDLAGFTARLDDKGVAYTLDPVPGAPIVQVNLHDCDGNHIHVDFDRSEAEGLV